MKDVVISGRRIARELWVFFSCFLMALSINVFAIIRFKTHWKELITTLHITIAVALILFVVVALIRIITSGCMRLFRRRFGREGTPAIEASHKA